MIYIVRKILVENDQGSEIGRSVKLRTVCLPDEFVEDTFLSLFIYFLQLGSICIGIFRKRLYKRGNSLSYVYTNPPPISP